MLPDLSNTAATSTTLPAIMLALSAKGNDGWAVGSLWLSMVKVALAGPGACVGSAKNTTATCTSPGPAGPPQGWMGSTGGKSIVWTTLVIEFDACMIPNRAASGPLRLAVKVNGPSPVFFTVMNRTMR